MSSQAMKGGLKTGDRSGMAPGTSKKRVHFFDDTKASSLEAHACRESKQDGAQIEAKTHYFVQGMQNSDQVFAKVTIISEVDGQAAANFSQKENMLHEKSSTKEFKEEPHLCEPGDIFVVSEHSPSTPPPTYCASSYDLASPHGMRHYQRHVKGVQRKLTYVVGSRDPCHRKFGVTNKTARSYKVVPEAGDCSLLMEYLAHQNLNMQMHGSGGDVHKKRCAWITPQSDPVYVAYHDEEWGVPVHEDRRLFELLVFAGAQAEIAWSTLLAKREAYRNTFAHFDPTILATYDGAKMASLRSQNDIMRSEARVQSIISNAKLVMKIVEEYGSFDVYLWSYVGYKPIVSRYRQANLIPARTGKSEIISKDLQRRGFRHAGPMVVYSLMQAAGLANDHLISCFRHQALPSTPSPPSPSPFRKPAKPLVTPVGC